jgi:thioredoxin-related protein
MREKFTVFIFLFLLVSFQTVFAQQKEELPIGSSIPMPDLKMEEVSGKEISLNESKLENGLLVIFSCNTCPYVKAWESRYLKVAALALENKIGVVALNPNEAMRSDKESLAEMVKISTQMKYNFPYAVDKNHVLADEFGATKTPHVYLFDNQNKLVFVGAIDDNSAKESEVKHTFLMDALKEVGANKEVSVKHSKALGCSIKRIK